jgi:hypothetical protein
MVTTRSQKAGNEDFNTNPEADAKSTKRKSAPSRPSGGQSSAGTRKKRRASSDTHKSTSTAKRAKAAGSAEEEEEAVVLINRSPVLQLWAACVAQQLYPNFGWSICLSAGAAIAALCAISKGKSIGVIEAKDKDSNSKSKKKKKEESAEVSEGEEIEVMKFKLRVRKGQVYVGRDPKPKYLNEDMLKKKFGQRYDEVKQAFQTVECWADRSDELNTKAFHMYEEFRPTVKSGQSGWGKKGELDLAKVRRVITK